MKEETMGANVPAVQMDAPILSPEDLKSQVSLVQNVMKDVMKKDEHYGTIPGCGNKPTLLKPGAEKLGFTFRLAPTFKIETVELPRDHREIRVVCTLQNIQTGLVWGEGVGSCSTMESKYRYREARKKCPDCGNDQSLLRSKKDPEWFCWAKKGGCGAKFPLDDPRIAEQKVGRAENPDIADTYNTVLKMAKKRAHVDAILTATAASDIFTQDVEDFQEQKPRAEMGKSPQTHQNGPGSNLPPERPQGSGRMATDPQRKKLYAMLKSRGVSDSEMKEYVKKRTGKFSSKQLTMDEIQALFTEVDGLADHTDFLEALGPQDNAGQHETVVEDEFNF
jgi:hypothetical protein